MNNTSEYVFLKGCTAFLDRASMIVIKFPSHFYLINQIFVAAFNSFLILPTIVLNAVSVAAIMKSTRLKTKPCYFLIVIQSLVDLIVGAVGIPLFVFYMLVPLIGTQNCAVSFLIQQTTFIPCGISILTLSVMAIERYVGVLHPYAYNTQVTKERILIYEGCGSFLIILVVGVSLPVKSVLTVFSPILILIFFILNTFVYTRIYFVVIKITRSNKIQEDNVSQQNSTKRQQFLSEVKQAKTCFIVLIFFVLCFLPMALAGIFNLDVNHGFIYQTWAITLIMINSSINSVIFFWTKKTLRAEALEVLKRSVAP